MLRVNRNDLIMMGISLFVLIASFVIIDLTYGKISENITIIKSSWALEENPDVRGLEIAELEQKRVNLNARLEKLQSLTIPALDDFVRLSNKFSLNLNEVNLLAKSDLAIQDQTGYTFIFSGNIRSILDALDFMEKNYLMEFERLVMRANAEKPEYVDLEISVILLGHEK